MKKRKIGLPKKITTDLAYLCGVFAGDGSLNYRKNKNEYSLKCVGNPLDEKSFYHKIIYPKFKKTFGVSLKIKEQDLQTTYGFVLYSKEIYSYLTSTIGLPSGVKYGSLHIPAAFHSRKELTIAFIKGVFDTDGCVSFKRRYTSIPYYPVISLASKSRAFVQEIAHFLRDFGLKPVLLLDYRINDSRMLNGFTIINTIELNGEDNLKTWIHTIGFNSPKHLKKIRKYWKKY